MDGIQERLNVGIKSIREREGKGGSKGEREKRKQDKRKGKERVRG